MNASKLALLTVVLAGCSLVVEPDRDRLAIQPAADGDADADTDADADADGDADADTDTDTDTDADTDGDADVDADTDGDADTDADGDADWPPEDAIEIGRVEGWLETRWGTLDDGDPLGTGSGSLDAAIDDVALAVIAIGAAAGPDPERPGRAVLDLVAVLDDGSVVVVWFGLGLEEVVGDTEVALELVTPVGALLDFDAATSEWSLIGLLDEGTLVLEEAGAVDGAAIRARFDAAVIEIAWP